MPQRSRHEELLARLHAISKTLQHHEWSLPFLLRMVLDAAVELAEAQSGSLVVLNRKGRTPVPPSHVHMDEGTLRAIEAILEERELLRQLDQGHQVLLVNDLVLPVRRDLPQRETAPVHAFCGAAIRMNDCQFGRLYLTRDQRREGTFREEHQYLIGTLVSHVGLAIQAASLVTQLRCARSQHAALLESTTEGLYGLDLMGRCTFINRAGAMMLGYQVEEVIGQAMHELIHHHRPDGSPYPRKTCSIYQVFRTGQPCRIDNEVLWKKDGSLFPVEFSASPLYLRGGLQGAVVTFHDITARKQAEVALRTSEEHYRILFENNPAPMFVYDLQTLAILAVNQAAIRQYGYSQSTFLGMLVVNLHPVQDRSEMRTHFRDTVHRRIEPEFQETGVWQHCKNDGTTFPVEIAWSPILFRGQPAGLILVHDMTEQRQAEEIRLQLLDRAMIAQEEERRRIARELHDETQQALTSLLVGLRTMEEAQFVEEIRPRVQTLRGIAGHALDELQRLVQGLRPALLDEMGLAAALERLRDEFVQIHGLRVELHVGNLTGLRLAPAIENTLYRIVQEALTNARKHAEASTVSVLMQATASCLRLVVEDNGCGFVREGVRKATPLHGGLGLCGMEERAKIVGAILTIESIRGKGTMIHVEVPLGTGG